VKLEVPVLKLDYLYMLIGISTLALNIALTLHIIKKHSGAKHKETRSYDDVIIFKLAGKEDSGMLTTSAIPYDDTIPLE
jgi:hypothetical protein